MTCRVIEVGGKRLVAFDAPTPLLPENGYRIDCFQVERKGYTEELKELAAAAAAYGDQGPEVAELVAFAVPDPADDDKRERMAEWSNARGSWSAWRDN